MPSPDLNADNIVKENIMKKNLSIISFFLLVCVLITSCTGSGDPVTAPSDGTSEKVPDTTATLAIATDAVTTAPIKEVKRLPTPYVDIEFTEDGGMHDAMDHVSCKLDDTKKGKVVNENVIIDNKEYKIPHLYITEKGGVGRLIYKDLATRADITELYSAGITLEAMVQNHNKFVSSSSEQIIAGTCQSGGYNLSAYKGAYTFSVYTGGAYRSAHNPGGVDNTCMTHLIGVYDPVAKTSTLYVNGAKVASVPATGNIGFASGDLWKQIILGGDIAANFAANIFSYNFRLADYKIYPSALSEDEAHTAYEQMRVKLTDSSFDYTLEYYTPGGDSSDQGDRLFSSLKDSYADVYEPKTSLVNSPSVIGYARKDTLSGMASAGSRPATLIFTVKATDGKLFAYEKDGKEISSLYDAIKALGGKIIPAFAIEDASISKQLCEFINYNRIGDCFVISSNADILKEVCKTTRSARPVLDMSGVSGVTVKDIRLKVSAAQAKNVILTSSQVNTEQISALRVTSHTVFLITDDGKANAHDSIFKGAMAIITENTEEAIGIIESFDIKTICIPTFLVAHRGDMQNCPENTLPSFISAAKSGAPALELDVYLTKDGHLAINHDAKTTYWDKKLTCTESTRDQLKALKSTSAKATADDTFTFLDEVFDYFSKNYTDTVIHVEIKDKRNAVVDKVVELAKATDMLDRILVIGSSHDIAKYASDTYGVAVQMTRSYIYDKNDIKATLAYACEEVVNLNSSYYTVWADSFDKLNTALRHRGIKYCTWTTTTASATDSDFAREYVEFTSNTPHRCDSYAMYLKATADRNGTVKVTRINYDGSEVDVTSSARLICISGNVSISNGIISGSGEFAFSYQTSIGNYVYELCSLSLTK